MTALGEPSISPERYLEMERKAEFRSEYHQGEIRPRSGASEAHNLLSSNLIAELSHRFRGRDSRVFGSQMRVRADSSS